MLVATFNANSVRARLETIVAWLDTRQPDILCIQETKVTDAEFPVEAFTGAGYTVIYRGEKSYNGVAIASRVPPEAHQFGFDDGGPADETRLVCARFGPLTVVNTYVPQGRDIDHPMYRYKLDWLQRLRGWFDRHFTPADRLLWTGDMNVAVEAIDIHNAERQTQHVCYHEDVRRVFAETIAWGFEDVFRRHHPDEPGHFTFFDYRTPNAAKRGMGWRIDHMLATPPLAQSSTGSAIDLEPRFGTRPSDHTFLTAEFEL